MYAQGRLAEGVEVMCAVSGGRIAYEQVITHLLPCTAPDSALQEYVRNSAFDLVICGAVGDDETSHAAIGSVAWAVLHEEAVGAVLVVR